MNIAIVDDEKEYVDVLKGYLERFREENHEVIQISVFYDALDIADEYQAIYDLIFLDIKMKHMDGLKAAGKIRQKDSKVILIFVTNMPQYAVNGYAFDAMDYVVKPMSYYDFEFKMKKAVRIIKERASRYILLNLDDGLRKIAVEQILYIEVVLHKITIHTDKGDFSCTGTLKEYEKLLDGYSFAKCNVCYLVNLHYVEEIRKNEVLIGENRLKISRPKKKEFLEAVTRYYGGGYI